MGIEQLWDFPTYERMSFGSGKLYKDTIKDFHSLESQTRSQFQVVFCPDSFLSSPLYALQPYIAFRPYQPWLIRLVRLFGTLLIFGLTSHGW